MKEAKMKTEDETQTFCEYICAWNVYSKIANQLTHSKGGSYWFHEDAPPDSNYFLPVIDSEGFPVTKTVRIDK